MYKHILLATDGSDPAERAMKDGLDIAKALGAKVTAVTVTRPWYAVAAGELMVAFPEEEYMAGAKQLADANLKVAIDAAKAAGITCETLHVINDYVHQGIIETAEKNNCDLIVMGSHGRSGLERLFLGSETHKVLAHTTIPVLVHR
jgi:nucleotide-binding universal stress UspA family protein